MEFVRGRGPIVAVNDAFKIAPFADALVALDTDWWDFNKETVAKFPGQKFATDPDVRDHHGARWVPGSIGGGLSFDWNNVRIGADSGFYAIAIAVLMGARRVVLLGYDMGSAADGKRHFFGDHPPKLRNSSPYELFLKFYQDLPRWCDENGVEIINCTRTTAIDCLPKKSLNEVFT